MSGSTTRGNSESISTTAVVDVIGDGGSNDITHGLCCSNSLCINVKYSVFLLSVWYL